jgi:carbon monoxide dehydrogenase subunit G
MAIEMDQSFTVPVSPDHAWGVLLDVERIAPCMPGATVEKFDGEVVTGRIKVKVGPVSLTYRGTAKFAERDADAKVIVLEAAGKETRGAGTASANVRAWLESEAGGEATKVSIHTTMNVTGRPAQFGRGVIVEVGGKLIDQFANNLAQLISDGGADAATAGDSAGSDGEAAASAPADSAAADSANAPSGSAETVATATMEPASPAAKSAAVTPPVSAPAPAAQAQDSINLVRLVGPAILKRAAPVAAGIAVLALLARRFGLFRRGRKS